MTPSLIIGASGAIGSALAAALATAGPVVTGSRRDDGLDLTDEDSIRRFVSALPHPSYRLIIDATGVLTIGEHRPERALSEIDPQAMAQSFAVNAIGPALLFKHLCPRLPRQGPSVFATLSARIGSISDNRTGGWYSYRAAKAGLNQLVRCTAIEVARKRPEAIIIGLHPGTVPSAMTEPYARGRFTHSAEACANNLLDVIRQATPQQSGRLLAYDGSLIAP